MARVLIVDNSSKDGRRYENLLLTEAAGVTLCASGTDALTALTESGKDAYAAAIVLWEIPGPPFGADILAHCRRLCPNMPVVVVTGALDASLATRAQALGARDFLEKPIDGERLRDSIRRLLAESNPLSPLVDEMRRMILGNSPALLRTLQEAAKVIPHTDTRVLLTGESGTGKELIAQAIHRLGSPPKSPFIGVNVGAIAETLIESMLFGHEKGAFTGASERHVGYLEEARDGLLFLDEIGDLNLSLQGKLLRVIQEGTFRRIKGADDLDFKARLVCATNRNLAENVRQGLFRRDLYHRIAQVTIHIPPLREREGDIDLLMDHFLYLAAGRNAKTRFARETRTILRSYPFPGNVRELQNLVNAAAINCESGLILPNHLPLKDMGVFVGDEGGEQASDCAVSWPENWLKSPYRDAIKEVSQAFDRLYFQRLLEGCNYNITQASIRAGLDTKTLRKHWKECGLPPLDSRKESEDDQLP
jgi:two-component system NtrC family response regulator